MKLNLSFILSVCICIAAGAQPSTTKVWSIDECVNYALENNLQVRQSALQVEVNKHNREMAWWDYSPNLNFNSNYGWNFGLNIDPVTNQISQSQRQTATMALSSNWVVFNGTRKINTITRSNLDYLASLYDLEAMKNDISLNVAAAYLQILLNKEIVEVAQEQLRVSELQLKRMSKLVEAGSSPKGDELQAQSQVARDRQNLIATQNALTLSKLELANLLQLENPDEFEISSPAIDVPEASLIAREPASIYEAAIEMQPRIKGAEMRVNSSEKSENIARSGALPSLSLNGQIGTSYSDQIVVPTDVQTITVPVAYYDTDNSTVLYNPVVQEVPVDYGDKPVGDQLSDNLNEYVGISLNVPIFNRLTVRKNLQNARINTDLARLQLDQEKNVLRQTIYRAHADARASYNSYLASEIAVESGQESFKYSQERYEVGALNQFDFENSKNSLAVAQSEMLRAKYDFIFKIKVLEFYLTNQVKL